MGRAPPLDPELADIYIVFAFLLRVFTGACRVLKISKTETEIEPRKREGRERSYTCWPSGCDVCL